VIATVTVAAGPERLRAITVQRPPRCASRIGKRVRQVESARLLLHHPLSCAEARTPRSTPYHVWTWTATSVSAGAVIKAFQGYRDGGGAVIANRLDENPADSRRTPTCGRSMSRLAARSDDVCP
jgi:hypothetical protein